MFGFFRKAARAEEPIDRQQQWQQSPTIPIVEPTSNKISYLLSNIGRKVTIYHRGEPCRIVPLAIFRKPAYGRTYVQAEVEGVDEPTPLNLSDIKLPPEATVRLARRKLELTPAATTSSLASAVLGLVLLIAAVSAGVFLWRGGSEQLHAWGLNPWSAPVDEPAPVAPTNPPSDSEPPTTSPVEVPGSDPAGSPADRPPIPPIPPGELTHEPSDPATTFGRVFTSKIGSTLRAEFVEFRFQGSRVILQKEDGQTIDISMNDLTKEDQQWIRDELKRRRASTATDPQSTKN